MHLGRLIWSHCMYHISVGCKLNFDTVLGTRKCASVHWQIAFASVNLLFMMSMHLTNSAFAIACWDICFDTECRHK